MLRDHPIFRSPFAIDRTKMIRRPWPAEWSDPHDSNEILVLPLCTDASKRNQPGWCTYIRGMSKAPEIEVFCGGINAKTSTAAGLWRQGNLLHFGFDLAPDEMNESGQAMLIDAIAYISRFTDDRPIMETPSPFAGQEFMTRPRIKQLITRGDGWWDYLASNFDRGTLAAAGVKDLASFAKWNPTVSEYLCPNTEGLLTVDRDAQAMERTRACASSSAGPSPTWGGPQAKAERARRMLARYAPEGPGALATPKEWGDWLKANADYLFFGEAGGYRWYLDPLAKARGVPTARLRPPLGQLVRRGVGMKKGTGVFLPRFPIKKTTPVPFFK